MILRIWLYIACGLFASVHSQRLYSAKFSKPRPPGQEPRYRPTPALNLISSNTFSPQGSTPSFLPATESTTIHQEQLISRPAYEFLPPLFESDFRPRIELPQERKLGQISDQARQEQIEHRFELERIEKQARIADQHAPAYYPRFEQVPERNPKQYQDKSGQQKLGQTTDISLGGTVDHFVQSSEVTQPLFPKPQERPFQQPQYQIPQQQYEQSAELPQQYGNLTPNQAFYPGLPPTQKQNQDQPPQQTEYSERFGQIQQNFAEPKNAGFEHAYEQSSEDTFKPTVKLSAQYTFGDNLQPSPFQKSTTSYGEPYKQLTEQRTNQSLGEQGQGIKTDQRIRNRIKQKGTKKNDQRDKGNPQQSIQQTTVQPTEETVNVNYNFQYKVNDEVTGDIKNREESRVDDEVKGSYSIVEPDGRVRIVEYTANDVQGFIANVRYEEPATKVPTSTQGPLKIRILKGD